MTVKAFSIRTAIILFVLLGYVEGQAPKPGAPVTGPEPFDILIKNGRIIDGSGNPWYSADVGVRGERIVAIGRLSDAKAKRVIDATGLVVAPGFIDTLGQSEMSLLIDNRSASKLSQGITSEITGEGGSIAPQDALTLAALRSLGVYDRIAPKLVMGENIAQTLEFVESGAAGAGIVALSLASAPAVRGKGRYWEIPATVYPPIEQAGVVLARARDPRAATTFLTFLGSDAAARILTNYGFSVRGRD